MKKNRLVKVSKEFFKSETLSWETLHIYLQIYKYCVAVSVKLKIIYSPCKNFVDHNID